MGPNKQFSKTASNLPWSMPVALAEIPEKGSHFDLVRPGVLFYGVYPSPHVPTEEISVRGAMRWVTPLVHMSEPCLAMVRASIIAGAPITQPMRRPGAISLESVPM